MYIHQFHNALTIFIKQLLNIVNGKSPVDKKLNHLFSLYFKLLFYRLNNLRRKFSYKMPLITKIINARANVIFWQYLENTVVNAINNAILEQIANKSVS